MKKLLSFLLTFFAVTILASGVSSPGSHVRVLVITGGHDYNKETFNAMFRSLGNTITYQIVEFPSAYDMLLPSNRDKYDVLVFYHMWQTISEEQKKVFIDCIAEGKPLVVLHHSICAFDDWEEYWHIIGGKYFHKPTVINGTNYPACTYIHDLHFKAAIVDIDNPVTKGMKDFDLFDETYKGYWIEPGVTPILTTTDTTSNRVIGWTKTYGRARIVTLQSGHDSPTFQNPDFRRLLKQSIKWVFSGTEK